MPRRMIAFIRLGRRLLSWKLSICSRTFFQRTIEYRSRSRNAGLRSFSASGSWAGNETMYVGERCSIVTCSARSAIAGTSVTAVAPLPITTTRLPE